MPTWLAVAFGGAGGAVLRWLVYARVSSALPYGTILVNVMGSFIMGCLFVVLASRGAGDPLRAGILVGFLGSFTTFSAFSLETVLLIEQGALKTALLYAASSVIICVLAAFAGLALARSF
ncbi:MAG: fluoride efflux transporter CrcB [Gammaproteobacteria bacterium]